jgi:hypothetical protein
MKTNFAPVIALGVLCFIAVLAAIFGMPPIWSAILLIALVCVSALLKNFEEHLPGGTKNPYTAGTVGKQNFGIRIAIWGSALVTSLLVYGLALWLMTYFARS